MIRTELLARGQNIFARLAGAGEASACGTCATTRRAGPTARFLLVRLRATLAHFIRGPSLPAMAQRSKSAICQVGVPQIQLGAGPTKWPRQAAQKQVGQTHGRRKSAE